MRIAHTCANCGQDLSRLRALIDPAYGLPIVVCPRCREAVVRRPHPVQVRLHQARRVTWAVIGLVLRISGTLAVSAAVLGLSVLLRDEWLFAGSRVDNRLKDREFLFWSAIWAAGAIVAGVWIGAMLPHWKAWRAVLAWAAILFAQVAVYRGLDAMQLFREHIDLDLVRYVRDLFHAHRIVLIAMATSILPLAIGMVPGRALAGFMDRSATRRLWRRRRRIRLGRKNE